MSRVIKFRAWDGLRMTNSGITFSNSSGCLTGKAYGPDSNEIDMPIMQFTGLQDSKGVDVYEGDLVNLHEYGEVYKEVLFHNGCFCVHGFNFNPAKCTVIGNIHENPELLEVES